MIKATRDAWEAYKNDLDGYLERCRTLRSLFFFFNFFLFVHSILSFSSISTRGSVRHRFTIPSYFVKFSLTFKHLAFDNYYITRKLYDIDGHE